jgi:hypothetical protein
MSFAKRRRKYTCGMANPGMYRLRFFFDWGGGCLWAGDDTTRAAFGCGPLDGEGSELPLSPQTQSRCRELGAWHDTSLNSAYPPDPGPWRQPECDRFNEAVKQLLATVRAELGEQFEVINQQREAVEDPDLDAYLADPEGFRRRTT